MTLEELQVVISATTKPLQNELKKVSTQLKGLENVTNKSMSGLQKSVDKTASSVGKVFGKLRTTLIALGIGKALKDSFNLARTYEASVQQVNRLFGLYSGALEKWVQQNAKTFGMARADAMKYASVYGNLVRSFEQDGAKMTQYTTDLMKATTIIASSTGRTVADVSERIRSGILGNTEAIEDLGIYAQVAMLKTTNAFKQIADGRSWEQLTFQEQQQIRVMSILEQTSNQFGDSIQNNMNYQLMQLTATLKNVALNIGQAFMPIVGVVVPILNTMANALEVVTAKLATFMNALFGTNFNAGAGANASTSQNFTNMGVEAQKAGEEAEKAGKKAKGALMGFDEVNTLNFGKDGGSGSGASGGNTGGLVETITPVEDKLETAATTFADRLKAELERLKALFKEGFKIGIGGDWKERLEELKQSIEEIKENLKNIFTDSEVVTAFNSFIDQFVLRIGKEVGSLASIGITIGQNLLGGFNQYLEQNQQFIKDRLIGIFNVSGEIADLVGDFSAAFADIFSVFGGETAQQITADLISLFSNSFLGVIELTLRFSKDVIKVIVDTIEENKESIATALENMLKIIQPVVESIEGLVTNTFNKVFEVYNKYIEPAFSKFQSGWSRLYKAILDAFNQYIAPTLQKIGQEWKKLVEQYVQPMINKVIDFIGKLSDTVMTIWNNVFAPYLAWMIDKLAPGLALIFESIWLAFKECAEWLTTLVGNVFDTFNGFLDFIKGVFSADWKLAWEGIKATFKGVVDTFESIVNEPFQRIMSWLNGTFTAGWRTMCDTFGRTWSSVWEGIKSTCRSAVNWVVDKINGMINRLNRFSIDLPDILGGGKIGFDIPHIPKLARGGIVDGATFMGNYIAGEAGKEMIVPLENTSFVDKLASALGNAVLMAMQFNSRGSSEQVPTEAVFEMDGREFARAIIPPLQKELKRIGVKLI